jgi:hypothetical protein
MDSGQFGSKTVPALTAVADTSRNNNAMNDNTLQSRPDRHIAIINRLIPGLWSRLDKARSAASSRPADVVLPSWAVTEPLFVRVGPTDPSTITVAAFRAGKTQEVYKHLIAQGFSDSDRILALPAPFAAMHFAWRATKMEFRFDADLGRELIATPVEGNIPTDILRRLPAGCVYVSVNNGEIVDGVCGFFAYIDQPFRGAVPVLRVFFDWTEGWPTAIYALPLSGINLSEFVAKYAEEHPHPNELVSTKAAEANHKAGLGKILSLLLYLCSEEPDLPSDFAPVRLRDKVFGTQRRCIAPQKVSAWPVGVRLGAVFRKAAAEAQGPRDPAQASSGVLCPHVRRAHWHTYWTGPKTAQTALLRWIAPVIVGAKSAGDTLSTTVRPVLPE